MKRMSSGIVLLLCLLATVTAETVLFPSGELFVPTTDTPGGTNYLDPENTGSKLYKIVNTADVNTKIKRLSLNMLVDNWRSQKDASEVYFRVHPTHINCVQKVWTDLQNSGKKVLLRHGYRSGKDVGSGTTEADRYAQGGTAAVLAFQDDEANKDFKLMASSALKHCIIPFGVLGRDLGLIARKDEMVIFMTGARVASKMVLKVEGSTTWGSESEFRKWAVIELNSVSEPENGVPSDCGAYSKLSSGKSTHAGTSNAAAVVGAVDVVVTRKNNEDLLRLVQYPSNNILFSDEESTSSWCGTSNNPCVSCKDSIVGHSATTRCADRLMTPRLFLAMNILQKLVRQQLNIRLKVTEAFDEPHAKKPQGDTPVGSLHFEGRQARLSLESSVTAANLETLTQLAQCAGMDYVKHNSNGYVEVAVKKQADLESEEVEFPLMKLMPVSVPDMKKVIYDVRSETDEYPLFDKDQKILREQPLDDGVMLADFASRDPEVRYFRLSSELVQCVSELQSYETGLTNSAKAVKIKVTRGFMTPAEEKNLLNPLDDRINKHTLGLAIQLSYDTSTSTGYNSAIHTIWRLAQSLSLICPPMIYKSDKIPGIGIYRTGVYLDLRDEFKVWYECTNCHELKPPASFANDQSQTTFAKLLQDMTVNSIKGRTVLPQDFQSACRAPATTSTTSSSCQPSSNTQHCRLSYKKRNQIIDELWHLLQRKHLAHIGVSKVKDALDNCLRICGTCEEGAIWEKKMTSCKNLVEWIPFATHNDDVGVTTNLYPRQDFLARRHACYITGQHCVDQSPLFGILQPSLETLFRQDENKPGNQELIYDGSENPSPLMLLINKKYARAAHGVVKLWLRNEADINSMAESLKVIFLENKRVKNVEVHVLNKGSQSAVVSVLEDYLQTWGTSGCPRTTRQFLTPYKIVDINNSDPAFTAHAAEFETAERIRNSMKSEDAQEMENEDFL